jgi:hypothetical protein
MDTKLDLSPCGIVAMLGEDAICSRLSVTKHAVRYQKARLLPSSWYVALNEMSDVPLPYSSFSFKAQEAAE